MAKYKAVFRPSEDSDSSWVILQGRRPVFHVTAEQAYGKTLDDVYTDRQGEQSMGRMTHRDFFESAEYGEKLAAAATEIGIEKIAQQIPRGRLVTAGKLGGGKNAPSDGADTGQIERKQKVPGIITTRKKKVGPQSASKGSRLPQDIKPKSRSSAKSSDPRDQAKKSKGSKPRLPQDIEKGAADYTDNDIENIVYDIIEAMSSNGIDLSTIRYVLEDAVGELVDVDTLTSDFDDLDDSNESDDLYDSDDIYDSLEADLDLDESVPKSSASKRARKKRAAGEDEDKEGKPKSKKKTKKNDDVEELADDAEELSEDVEELADDEDIEEMADEEEEYFDVVELTADIVAPMVSSGEYTEDQVITELTEVFSDEDAVEAFSADLQERVTAIQAGGEDMNFGAFTADDIEDEELSDDEFFKEDWPENTDTKGLPSVTASTIDQALRKRVAKKKDEGEEDEAEFSSLNPDEESLKQMGGEDFLDKPLIADMLADELAPVIAEDEDLVVSDIVDGIKEIFEDRQQTAAFRGLIKGKVDMSGSAKSPDEDLESEPKSTKSDEPSDDEKYPAPELTEEKALWKNRVAMQQREIDNLKSENHQLKNAYANRVKVARAREMIAAQQERDLFPTVDKLVKSAASRGQKITVKQARDILKPRIEKEIVKIASLDDAAFSVLEETVKRTPIKRIQGADNQPINKQAGMTAVFMPDAPVDQSLPAFSDSGSYSEVVIAKNSKLYEIAKSARDAHHNR